MCFERSQGRTWLSHATRPFSINALTPAGDYAVRNHMLEFLKSLLGGQNQFASGGLLLMIIGAVGVYLRSIPMKAWEYFVEQTTMLITVKDDDAAFRWVKEWLLEQEFLKRVRRLDLDTTIRNDQMALIPAPGRHWFWYDGRPFVVDFYRSEEKKAARWEAHRSESLTFRTIGRDRIFLQRFVRRIAECHQRNLGVRSPLFVFDDGWTRVEGYAPRSLDSVILPTGEKERLVRDIERFRSSRDRYRRLGVPYHRGYLLFGPPGTGKTSLVSAIAAEFQMCLYVVNLGDFSDRSLPKAMNDVPPNSVILFEDIDCMKGGKARPGLAIGAAQPEASDPGHKEAPSIAQVTLSGLLNVLDGFNAPENVLFVMTSNCIEDLDAALLRPGRIDYRLYLGHASVEQKVELYRRFFPEASELEARTFVEFHNSIATMAELQGLLLELENNVSSQIRVAGLETSSEQRIAADMVPS